MSGDALELRVARAMDEDEHVRRAPVVEPERHARELRVDDRSLALDEEQVARAAPSTTSLSPAPARKSETTASTAMPQPAIMIPVWPVGTKTERRPRARAARSSSTATVFLPTAQSEPTVRTTSAASVRFSPVGTLRSDGGRR